MSAMVFVAFNGGFYLGLNSFKKTLSVETPKEVEVNETPKEILFTPIEETKEQIQARLEDKIKELEKQVEKLNRKVARQKKTIEELENQPQEQILACGPTGYSNEPTYTFNNSIEPNYKHRIYGIFGYGIKGAKIQSDGNQVWVEPTRGFVGGFGYQYKITPRFNIGVGTVGAETFFGTIGSDF